MNVKDIVVGCTYKRITYSCLDCGSMKPIKAESINKQGIYYTCSQCQKKRYVEACYLTALEKNEKNSITPTNRFVALMKE